MRSLVRLGIAVVGMGAAAIAASGTGCNSSTTTTETSGDSGVTPVGDGSTPPGDGGTTTLYTRLGGHSGIRNAVNAIVTAELMEPEIATYFFNQVASPTPAGHPSADQLEECLTYQLANAAGGPEKYPTTLSADAGSFACRDMTTIHGPLNISGGTFDKFVTIAAGVLQTAGVSSADIGMIGGVLNGTKASIVDSALADAGELPYSDAGAPVDAGTLYQRLGGHTGIRNAVNAIVTAELADTDIASYFFNQVASPVPQGHPTEDQLEECFTDLLAKNAGGTETYPFTVTDDAGSFTCRDMSTIHTPLKISGGTFDKFVTIAAGVLTGAGVSATDIGTIGTVLNSTESSIVDSNLQDAGELPYDASSP